MNTIVQSTYLTAKEEYAWKKLEQVDEDSLWGNSIHKALEQQSVLVFRELIESLLSQNDDDAEVMKKILGKAYDAVMDLRVENENSYS